MSAAAETPRPAPPNPRGRNPPWGSGHFRRCSTTSKGISLWRNGRRSARKGSVSLFLSLQHHRQRHQPVSEWRRTRKERHSFAAPLFHRLHAALIWIGLRCRCAALLLLSLTCLSCWRPACMARSLAMFLYRLA